MSARALICVVVMAIASACGTGTAVAAPGPPHDLEVLGDPGWHSERNFEVGWESPPVSGAPLVAAHYELRTQQGTVLAGPLRTETPVKRLDVRVPGGPGAYELEVWLEDQTGATGPPATTLLRFDDSRPGTASPQPHRAWIGRAELPLQVRIAHPSGPQPPAGIRGYAVSLDRDPEGRPCAAPGHCDADETDLRGGIGDDAFPAWSLPEGLSYVHAVAVSGSGVPSEAAESVPLRVDLSDPVTRIAGLPDGWVDRAVVLRATAVDTGSGMAAGGAGDPFTAIGIDGGAPTISLGSTATATVIGSGIHTVAYFARDAAGNVDDGATSNGNRNPPPSLAEVRIDRDPPSVAFLPSAHADDPELLEARVGDPLSGPDASRGWIGVRSAGSGAPFEPLPTSAQGGVMRARWNSDDYPAGEYEFEAVAHDRAGNLGDGTRRVGGAPVILPSPLKTPTVLSASIGHYGEGTAHTVPYGRGATYRGRLALRTGTPLAGLPVRVVERFAAGAGIEPRTTQVATGPGGRFSLHLAPGPSREVLAFFSGTSSRARAAAAPWALAVRGGLRLAASATRAEVGGRPVVFRGRIAGEVPRDGLAVALQFRLPGLPWSEFRTLHSDARGRFRYAYRFSDDDSRGVRFLFRAVVDEQAGWPYERGASLPLAVRGE